MVKHRDDCDSTECVTECDCGRGSYQKCLYRSCYECFLDRRSHYIMCILCGRWHSPEFDTCFKCKPQTHGRDDAAAALRWLILWRDGFTCRYCGIHQGEEQVDPRRGPVYAEMHVDHIVPCAAGGTADEWNLQVLCSVCNISKGSAWWPGCRHDRAKTELCRMYFLLGRTYFGEEEWQKFYNDVLRYRQEKTWNTRERVFA